MQISRRGVDISPGSRITWLKPDQGLPRYVGAWYSKVARAQSVCIPIHLPGCRLLFRVLDTFRHDIIRFLGLVPRPVTPQPLAGIAAR